MIRHQNNAGVGFKYIQNYLKTVQTKPLTVLPTCKINPTQPIPIDSLEFNYTSDGFATSARIPLIKLRMLNRKKRHVTVSTFRSFFLRVADLNLIMVDRC